MIASPLHFFFLDKHAFHVHFKDHASIFSSSSTVSLSSTTSLRSDRNHFTGIFIHKVFHPCTEYGQCWRLPKYFCKDFYPLSLHRPYQTVLGYPYCFKTDWTQQCGNREFFFTVDVSIHHIVDVGCKFHPVHLWKELPLQSKSFFRWGEQTDQRYTRWTVQLDTTTRSAPLITKVPRGVVRNITEKHILHDGLEIHMFFIITAQAQFSL